jgi:hypothetical protein
LQTGSGIEALIAYNAAIGVDCDPSRKCKIGNNLICQVVNVTPTAISSGACYGSIPRVKFHLFKSLFEFEGMLVA